MKFFKKINDYYIENGLSNLLRRILSEVKSRYFLKFENKKLVPIAWMYSERNPNFGDELNFWLYKKITGIEPSRASFGARFDHVISIGTVLDRANQNSIVWGAGGTCVNKPKKILAVRGPITKQSCDKLGIECPDVFGDPAILVPMFYSPKKPVKRHEFVVAPHVSDFPLVNSWYEKDSATSVIDLKTTDFEAVIDELNSGKLVITSSLHALIIALVYGVPVVWARFQSDFTLRHQISIDKFIDFLQGVGVKGATPLLLFGNAKIILEEFDFSYYVLRLNENSLKHR